MNWSKLKEKALKAVSLKRENTNEPISISIYNAAKMGQTQRLEVSRNPSVVARFHRRSCY